MDGGAELFRSVGSKIIAVLIAFVMVSGLAGAAPAAYSVSSDVSDAFQLVKANSLVQKGLDFIKTDDQNTLNDQKIMTAIPSPPFKEKARGEYFKKRLAELGLKDVKMDSEGNVYGIRPGTGKGPKLLVEAHLDTVFPEGTDVKPVEKDGKIYAPGIADNDRGLAAILTLVRAFNASGIKTTGDIIFAGTTGEEGLGDLRGMKTFFRDHVDVTGSISIDGTDVGRVTYLATGSHRYEITFKGPGGHSFGAFGLPSAIHAMGRAIAKIDEVRPPKEPRTTFTVGTVTGGASVNSIAAEATMLLDMRSNSQEELLKIESQILGLVQEAVVDENARWNSDKISVVIKLVGDRPAGSQPADSRIVQVGWAATEAIGQQPVLSGASSTNANLPISIGVPALTLGGGGLDGRNHSPDEWFDPKDAYLGPQKIFTAILGLVGIEGVTSPLLK